ncbi:MAG: EAL domain-containing protein [Pseudomonadota bacterium]
MVSSTKLVSAADIEGATPDLGSGFDLEIYRTIVDGMQQGVLVYDEHKVLMANERLSELLDCPPELIVPGASLDAFIEFGAARGDYSASVGLTLQTMRMRIATGKDYTTERNLPDGRRVRIDVRNRAKFGIGTYTDVTQARKQSALIETTIGTMPQGLLVCDATNIVASNLRIAELTGVAPQIADVGQPWRAVFNRLKGFETCNAGDQFVSKAARAFEDEASFSHELTLDERTLLFQCHFKHSMLFMTVSDVSEARARERLLEQRELEVRKLADTDGLTGLANRRSFDAELARRFEEHKTHRPSKYVVLLLIDLDRFKVVNDTHGHGVGDALLQELSSRFSSMVGRDHMLARIGGDEFAAILYGDTKYEIEETARRICDAAARPVSAGDVRIQIGASVGLAYRLADMADADELLTAADLALYDAKERGRGKVRVYAPRLGERAQQRYTIESDLKRALQKHEFVLHYQVQRSLATDEPIGYEALIRWQHPENGLIPPGEFIPVAEDTGLIVDMGRWALLRAASDIAERDNHSRVSVNVSPIQFEKGDLVADVEIALAKSGLSPDRLEIEVTEDLLIKDTRNTFEVLSRLRDIGVGISLDDFGAGYSSLAYLTRFPFTKLKIDRMFIDEMMKDESTKTLVKTMLLLASSLNLKVTAEGVETKDQLELLRRENCDEVQGFLLGRPSPIS